MPAKLIYFHPHWLDPIFRATARARFRRFALHESFSNELQPHLPKKKRTHASRAHTVRVTRTRARSWPYQFFIISYGTDVEYWKPHFEFFFFIRGVVKMFARKLYGQHLSSRLASSQKFISILSKKFEWDITSRFQERNKNVVKCHKFYSWLKILEH